VAQSRQARMRTLVSRASRRRHPRRCPGQLSRRAAARPLPSRMPTAGEAV